MDIGAAINSLRKSKRMTQKEFAKNIISTSFLSKVENSEHRISAEDLFLLLKKNNVDIYEFYLTIDTKTDSFIHIERISNAYYSNDVKYLQNLAKIIPNSTISNKKYYQLIVNILIFILQNDVESIPPKVIADTKNQLFASQNWDELTLSLLVNIFFLYEVDTLEYFLEDILKKKPLRTSPTKIIILIYSLILNLIYMLFLSKNKEKVLSYVKILEQVTVTPELIFQKSMLNYYRKLYDYIEDPSESKSLEIQEAINLFEILGMDTTVKKLQEYKEKVLLS